jgi:hypothetical protein
VVAAAAPGMELELPWVVQAVYTERVEAAALLQ